MLRVTILGSGTSSGVPVIGCKCDVCTSADPRNRRLRTSASVEIDGKMILLDTSPDLREQALKSGLSRVDGVLFTHAHADHVHGIDELRIFNLWSQAEIPCYGNPDTIDKLANYFRYIVEPGDNGGFRPLLDLHPITGPFSLSGIEIIPIPLVHGRHGSTGYRLGPFAYLTDVKEIPYHSMELLDGVTLLVMDALREKPHPTHMCVSEACAVADALRPSRTILTHLSHQVEHASMSQRLPPGVELAFDGMILEA